MNEIKVLKEIDHPSIINIMEFYESKKHIYLVSEFLEGGELFDRIEAFGKFSEYEARKIMK